MPFHYFVLPFTVGLIILLVVVIYKFAQWIINLERDDRIKMLTGIFSIKSIKAIKEVVSESLLHRKIFKVNPVLGYMHMSLAFGWFLLIVIGNFEAMWFGKNYVDPPYVAIFYKYFHPVSPHPELTKIFNFILDFLLLTILSGVFLALMKRFKSKIVGMKKTTVLKPFDKMALYSLWAIFPLRLLAESFVAGTYNINSFLTGTLGDIFNNFLPVKDLIIPAYWGYSLALGIFFISLPYSRYMHIPTEVLLIFARHYGVKARRELDGFAQMELNACSRCGICIDACQLASAANINNVQMVYIIRSLRENNTDIHTISNCLLCGRCEQICPVGINLTNIRQTSKLHTYSTPASYEYLPVPTPEKTEILYFAGCMTHITKSIKESVIKIFKAANVNYTFMDENNEICCGRPSMLAGDFNAFEKLKNHNIEYIKKSKAKLLITSCPICLKTFKEDYALDIEIMHHSQYFKLLIEQNKLQIEKLDKKVVYHDPCELGRGLGIYDEPRKVLNSIANITSVANEKQKSLCCGGSLANTEINTYQRFLVTKNAYKELTVNNPDYLITGCPLCKRTFRKASEIPVKDIAEIIVESMNHKKIQNSIYSSKNLYLQKVI
jgi:Fe-S oxidoreductase